MKVLDAEVLVVGGGPAGAATAALLARSGRDVLILEKANFPREKPCGEYYSPGVVDSLGRLGALEAVTAEEHAWLTGMRVGTEKAGFLLSYPEEDHNRRALGIRRNVLDRVLLDHAHACGARVLAARALGAVVDGGRVVGVRVGGHGRGGEDVLRSRFVVAADGRRSAIARSLGLEAPVRWPRRLGLATHYAGAFCELGPFGEMHVGRGLYCGLGPVGGGLVSVGLVVTLGEKPAGEPTERFFERRLAGLAGAARTLRGAERVGPVRGVGPMARRVKRVAGPGYLLVGDAAGFLDPFTGEGVHRALRGAELAAEAVEGALVAGSDVAVGYERARRAAFAQKERLVGIIQLSLSSPRLFGYVAGRLAGRPSPAVTMKGVLGDYRPAAEALKPTYLWSLLRP
ncbi:MAG: NAD(P)/FAD-dependent oxidoreductase [Actinomycetota bacterium]|nr:NAD(P)/FAD-dependent oxidoreductase [Actinomycetota bacterium]